MKTIHSFWKLAIFIAAVSFTSCSYDEAAELATGADDSPGNFDNRAMLAFTGHVYIEGNELGLNLIHIYQHNQQGQLTYVGNVPSGGAGNGISLGSQGAVILSPDKQWLYAVNAGSNSVSAFTVGNDGFLTLISTVNSGGQTPVSITIHDNWMYAVHLTNGTINGFMIGEDGSLLSMPESEQKLSDDVAGPSKIAFSPNGGFIYVTEKKTDKISIFPVDETGHAGIGTVINAIGSTPSGFDFARNNYIIVANGAYGTTGESSVTSYNGLNSGNPADVNGNIANSQTLSGWVEVTQNNRTAFVSNYGSNTVSIYSIGVGGTIQIAGGQTRTGNGPTDLAVSSHNQNLFVLCPTAGTIEEYDRTPLGGLVHIGHIDGVPGSAAGMANW